MSTQVVNELVIPARASEDNAGWQDAAIEFIEKAHSQAQAVTLTATEQVFTPAEAGRMTGTSKTGIQRRINDGTIKAIKVGSRWLVSETEVDRYRCWLLDGLAATVSGEPFDD